MLFMAQTDNKEYEIDVQEQAFKWQVQITDKQNQKTEKYAIPKKDFRKLGEFISFIFNHRSYLMDIVTHKDDYTVFAKGSLKTIKLLTEANLFHSQLTGKLASPAHDIYAGMPGKVIEITTQTGKEVQAGDLLLVMEAMKMENEIRASQTGVVKKIYVREEESVETGTRLLSLQTSPKK